MDLLVLERPGLCHLEVNETRAIYAFLLAQDIVVLQVLLANQGLDILQSFVGKLFYLINVLV